MKSKVKIISLITLGIFFVFSHMLYNFSWDAGIKLQSVTNGLLINNTANEYGAGIIPNAFSFAM